MFLHLRRAAGYPVEAPGPSGRTGVSGKRPAWQGLTRESWGEGSGHRRTARPCPSAPGHAHSQLWGAPVHCVQPQVPGLLRRTGRAQAACQHGAQTNVLFYVPAPAPAPGIPTADCLWGQEAGGQPAGPSCMPTAWLLAAGAGVGGTGVGRQDSGPYTTEQGLPHRRGLHPQPKQPASCRTRPPFHGESGSLEGNVPRTH